MSEMRSSFCAKRATDFTRFHDEIFQPAQFVRILGAFYDNEPEDEVFYGKPTDFDEDIECATYRLWHGSHAILTVAQVYSDSPHVLKLDTCPPCLVGKLMTVT